MKVHQYTCVFFFLCILQLFSGRLMNAREKNEYHPKSFTAETSLCSCKLHNGITVYMNFLYDCEELLTSIRCYNRPHFCCIIYIHSLLMFLWTIHQTVNKLTYWKNIYLRKEVVATDNIFKNKKKSTFVQYKP